jgi:carbonic anhydrase
MTNQRFGIMDQWLRNIKDVYYEHRDEIRGAGDTEAQVNRLVELSVFEQVRNITKSASLQKAWAFEKRPTLHGWVFGLNDGLLKSLYRLDPDSPIEDIYRYDSDSLR